MMEWAAFNDLSRTCGSQKDQAVKSKIFRYKAGFEKYFSIKKA
eukprot:IDg20829t1